MVARRAFLVSVHVGGSYPIPSTDDSFRHAFTRPITWDHLHPRVTCPPDRVTIKALPASLHPPSPLREIPAVLRLMHIRADKSAACTINRLPVPQTGSLRVSQAFDHLVEQLGKCTEGVGHECTLAALVHACSIWSQIDYR